MFGSLCMCELDVPLETQLVTNAGRDIFRSVFVYFFELSPPSSPVFM